MTRPPPEPRLAFQPGAIVATPGALELVNHRQLAELLRRHLSCDWGDLDPEDKEANDRAVKHGERILSSYHTESGEKLWLITERDRSQTTVLCPGEY